MTGGGRERRLLADADKMSALAGQSSLIDIEAVGQTLERYRVRYRCKGLFWPAGAAAPSVTARHELDIYLHKDFPRRPPQLTWRTDIFHPNILSYRQNGGVCVGNWSPAEGLDDLVVRIGEMVQMKVYNLDDPLDSVAAEWGRRHLDSFPLDSRPLLSPEAPPATASDDQK